MNIERRRAHLGALGDIPRGGCAIAALCKALDGSNYQLANRIVPLGTKKFRQHPSVDRVGKGNDIGSTGHWQPGCSAHGLGSAQPAVVFQIPGFHHRLIKNASVLAVRHQVVPDGLPGRTGESVSTAQLQTRGDAGIAKRTGRH